MYAGKSHIPTERCCCFSMEQLLLLMADTSKPGLWLPSLAASRSSQDADGLKPGKLFQDHMIM